MPGAYRQSAPRLRVGLESLQWFVQIRRPTRKHSARRPAAYRRLPVDGLSGGADPLNRSVEIDSGLAPAFAG